MNKTTGKKIPASALLVIIGLILIIFRNAAPEVVMRILAVGLMVIGAAGIFLQVRDKEAKKSAQIGWGILNGIYIILGIAMLIKTGFFTEFFKYVLGGIMILFGIKDLIPAIKNRKGWLIIVLSVLAIGLGVFLLFSPADLLVLFSGFSLIYGGIASTFSETKKEKKQ